MQRIEEELAADRIVAALAGAPIPTLADARAALDAALTATSTVAHLEPEQAELRQVLGVA